MLAHMSKLAALLLVFCRATPLHFSVEPSCASMIPKNTTGSCTS